jgi:hypothetical protein
MAHGDRAPELLERIMTEHLKNGTPIPSGVPPIA